MRELLNFDDLEGAHLSHVFVRPRRIARTVKPGALDHYLESVRYLSQVWGGAAVPILPIDSHGYIDDVYRPLLPGSLLDGVRGAEEGAFKTGGPVVELGLLDLEPDYWSQLAVAMLKYRDQEAYSAVIDPELAPGDVWRDIYATCLGQLPTHPDGRLLRGGNLREDLSFEDFLRIERPLVRGSLTDLMERLRATDSVSPRLVTLWGLASGQRPTRSLVVEDSVLPDPSFRAVATGPNIVVVCSPQDVRDLSLLWNLRGAHGESHAMPIGIPTTELDAASRHALNEPELRAHVGWGTPDVTFVSASLSIDELRSLVTAAGGAPDEVVGVAELVDLGPGAGSGRYEILNWQRGRAPFIAINDRIREEIVRRPGFNRRMGLIAEVSVLDAPIPAPKNARFDGVNVTYIAGTASMSVQSESLSRDVIDWPSSLLATEALFADRGLRLMQSEPGRACAVLCSSFSNMGEIGFLAHAPLLDLLQTMAETRGASLMKRKARQLRVDEPEPTIAALADDLPERSADAFRSALGNSRAATEAWLLWAESHQLIVKGFPLVCSECQSKQWLPVQAFRPPIVCSGCGMEMTTPFGRRTQVQFTYRITERLRRVYECDAIGHLLAAYYFTAILGQGERGRLIGVSPGVEVANAATGWQAEIDLLLIDRRGEAIPVEVKKAFTGVTRKQVDKLDEIAVAIRSPWSAFVVPGWSRDAPPEYSKFAQRNGRSGDRLMLTNEHLLSDRLIWSMGQDPFRSETASDAEIQRRQAAFPVLVTEWIDKPDRWYYELVLRGDHDRSGV